jgi:2-polyprenyl-3-methyl-5-hydroxy-6-metoxy-1,4-benzoquinol methylase
MNKDEYSKMADFERYYWWHKGKVNLIKALLQRYIPERVEKRDLKILEIGCGTGEITEYLCKIGNVIGIDVSEEAIDYSIKRGMKNVFVGDITSMNIDEYLNKFDLILALDVIEHIQEDTLVLSRINQMLVDGGLLVVNVPAHKFLWSEHDEALHHKRRYSKLELTEKVKDSGLKIVKVSYFVSTVFFPILLFRLWGSLFSRSPYPRTTYVKLPNTLNNLMIKVLDVESKFVTKTGLPLGVTLTLVAQK